MHKHQLTMCPANTNLFTHVPLSDLDCFEKNQAMGGRKLEKTGEALNKQLLSIAWRDRRHIHPTWFHFQPPSEVS
jgi:hypothetical protein